MEERIQKLMAEAGIGSRRDCEALIEAGRVTVNGRLAQWGENAALERDTILVDGQPLQPAQQLVYIALYKPRGVLSAVESPDPRPTVRDLVPVFGRVYPVGRLDVDSEGLILLTNDGDLANRLTHPRYGHEKEYRVLVARRPDDVQLETWRRGVVLEDGYRTQPAEVRMEGSMGKGAWLRIILREGRKRQIRETGARIGLPVVKIIRVRIGGLTIGALKPREWRYLTPQEVAALKGEAAPVARGSLGRRIGRSSENQPAARGEGRPGRAAPARHSPQRGLHSESGGGPRGGFPGRDRRSNQGKPEAGSRSERRGGRSESGDGLPGRSRRPAGSGDRSSGGRSGDRGRPGERRRSEERWRDDREHSPQHGRPGGRPATPGGSKPPHAGHRPTSGRSRPSRPGGPAGRPSGRSTPRPGGPQPKKKR